MKSFLNGRLRIPFHVSNTTRKLFMLRYKNWCIAHKKKPIQILLKVSYLKKRK